VHLTADEGWINDPLSPTWDGERYHLFFQRVPGSTSWAPQCHWGHAVSDDLLTWRQLPDAIAPGDGDGGVWSGSVVARPGGGHRAFYTAVDVGSHAIGRVRAADAASLDGPWVKGEVVVTAPDDLRVTSFRDPFVERVGEGWRMLVAASLAGDGADGVAAVLSWSSPDLDAWSFDGVAASRSSAEREPLWTGSLWECPQLVAVDGIDVLLASVWHRDELHHAVAAPVRRDGAGLGVLGWQQLTAGPGLYAPVAFRDADGEPCVISWIRGYAEPDRAGVLSVPHRLVVREGRVGLALHPAVAGRPELVHGPFDLTAGPVTLGGLTLSHVDGGVLVDLVGVTSRLAAPADGVVVLLDGAVVEVLTRGTCFAGVLPDPS
jgi:beta-fructofuranosidase